MDDAQLFASKHWWSDRIGRPRELLRVFGWLRFLADRFVIVPAARTLPLGAALWLAGAAGWLDATIPSGMSRAARREIEVCTGATGMRRLRLVARRLAGTRRDLVYHVRMNSGRERPERWTLIQENGGPISGLLSSGRPFVIASGHFLSSASTLRYKALPQANRPVSGELPRWMLSPLELRRRLTSQSAKGARHGFYRTTETADELAERAAIVPDLWAEPRNWAEAPARIPSVQDAALARLREPGATVSIYPDVHWDKPNAYHRPFAGVSDRRFAIGAARIARLASCPIVPYVAVHGPGPRTVTITWGEPIEAGDPDDKSSDIRVMDRIIDFIERQVALHPCEYLLGIGHERRWDPASERWICGDSLEARKSIARDTKQPAGAG